MEQIIGSGRIDSFMTIESIIKSIHFPNIGFLAVNCCKLDQSYNKVVINKLY